MADAVRVAVYGTGRTGRALVPLCVQAGHTVVAGVVHAAGRLTAGPGTVEGFDHAVRGIDAQGAVAVELSWCGVLDPPSRELIAGVDLHLRGPDGLELTAHLDVPADPYPGTAARMVKAIPALRALPAGLYGPADLPVGRGGVPA
jgi:hypothetical protein